MGCPPCRRFVREVPLAFPAPHLHAFGQWASQRYPVQISVLAVLGARDRSQTPRSPLWLGFILVNIVVNACEHASAVRFPMRTRLAPSIGIPGVSSTQIALFVVPFSVIVGDKDTDLNFGQFRCMVLLISALVFLVVFLDSRYTWFEGYLLIIVYRRSLASPLLVKHRMERFGTSEPLAGPVGVHPRERGLSVEAVENRPGYVKSWGSVASVLSRSKGSGSPFNLGSVTACFLRANLVCFS